MNKEITYDGLKVKEEKMNQLSQKKKYGYSDRSVGVPISSLDKSKWDTRNTLGVVMERTADGFYIIGTKYALISSLYTRNQIQSCK